MWNLPLAARRLALQLIAIGSLLAGGATLWTILDPVSVRATETWVLLAVLSLFVLPVGAIALFEADLRSRARAARHETARRDEDGEPIRSHDITAGADWATDRSAATAEADAVARRHAGRKMVSARRPARSAPGRSRASTRR